MSTKKADEPKAIEILANNALPVLSVDHLLINARGDGACLLRFSAQLPEGIVEQTKLMVNADRLKEMVDIVCKVIDYFPEKPNPQEMEEQKKTRKKKK